ncbi:DUF190 domain-containing protein [Halodesulfovibrio sp.]|uniref:DUF190 domain-containing protein n=1 Tax=Halodesulfovibrio sp. TaxID=1912772 RepID=UPI0025C6DE00|nr:DUF190 domain-containing protein [Halodesulfovibrio sp.]
MSTTIEKITCVTIDFETYNGQPLYKALLEVAGGTNVLQATATKGLGIVNKDTEFTNNSAFKNPPHPIFVHVIGTEEDSAAFLKKAAPMVKNHVVLREKLELFSNESTPSLSVAI